MKANELRSGNLVKYKHLSESSSISAFDIVQISDDNSNVEPIPLTEDWLLKFGFEEKMFGWWSNVLFLRTDNRDGFFYDWQKTNETTGTYIEYVHQLQNLYFALTSLELTLKETE